MKSSMSRCKVLIFVFGVVAGLQLYLPFHYLEHEYNSHSGSSHTMHAAFLNFHVAQSIQQKLKTQRLKFNAQCRHRSELPAEFQGSSISDKQNDVWIYVITPTKQRLTQTADLTRLAATLAWVPRLHWIVVEDNRHRSDKIARLLSRSRVSTYTHLWIRSGEKRGRGIAQRNLALSWIRYEHKNSSRMPDHVVYFADDDNSYDERIFEYIRSVQYVGVWPVGLVGGSKVEAPKLDMKTGKIVDWHAVWKPKRLFHLDMAGFAVSVRVLLFNPTAHFHKDCQKFITLEACFLRHMRICISDLEPKSYDLVPKQVLVWHTRTGHKGHKGGDYGFEV